MSYRGNKNQLRHFGSFSICVLHCIATKNSVKQRTDKHEDYSSIFQIENYRVPKKSLVVLYSMIFLLQRNFTRPQAVSGLRKALAASALPSSTPPLK